MKHGTENNVSVWSSADLGLSALLLLFPLFVHERYVDITFSKFACFFVLSGVAVLLCFVARHRSHCIRLEVSRSFTSKDPMDLWFLLFFAAHVLAVVFSDYPFNALVGYAGRYMGFDFMLAVGAVYFFVGKYYLLKEREINVLMLSAMIVCAIALLQVCGYNPFHLYAGMDERNKKVFLSTIGNINVFSSFLSLVIPLAFGQLCFQKSKSTKTVFLLVALLVCWSVQLLSNSDSGYLGVFSGCWLLGCFALKKKDSMLRFLGLLLLFCIPAFAIRVLADTGILTRTLSTSTSMLLHTVLLPVFAILSVMTVILWRLPLDVRQLKRLRNVYLFLSLGVLAFGVGSVLYFSVINRTVPLGRWEHYLRLSAQWGTERGSIWMMCVKAFHSFSLKHKIFGFGEDTLMIALSLFSKKEMLEMGYYTNNAHNEYLQYLLTIGVFGLVSYLGLLFHACRRLLCSQSKRVLALSLAGAIVAYAVQAVVNISQPITTPLFFILLVCARCVEKPCCNRKIGREVKWK